MGKYRPSYALRESEPMPWKIHPVWRGVGCILIVLAPVLSYAGGVLLVRENFKQGWVAIPPELARFVQIPNLGRVYAADVLASLILLVIAAALLTVLYSIFYRLFGPPRYGPLDVPPIRYKKRRR